MYQLMQAADVPHLLLVPGEEHGGVRPRPAGSWAQIIGSTALYGSKAEILTALDNAREVITGYFLAEHENAYHTEVEPGCPECREHGPTVQWGVGRHAASGTVSFSRGIVCAWCLRGGIDVHPVLDGLVPTGEHVCPTCLAAGHHLVEAP